MKENKKDRANHNNYLNLKGSNPFGTQAKMLLQPNLERLYEYISTGDTTPIFMEVNLTNKCNLKCKWCISENCFGTEELKIDPLNNFLRDFKEMGGKAITFSGGGEPTLYSNFEEAVNTSKLSNLELGLMTNGAFDERLREIIGNNFKWARFSLDTLNPLKYEKWKGIDKVDKVKSNIESLRKYPVKVGINCNIGEEHTIEDIRELIKWSIKEENADYLQFRPILPRYFKREDPKPNEEVWNYLDSLSEKGRINLSNDKRKDVMENNLFPFKSCEGHFFEPILDATGEIKVCMYHPEDKRFSFGNIYEKSFREIWKSEDRKRTIKFLRNKLNYEEECQMCCKLYELNKLIDFIKNPQETEDINFL